MGLKKKIGLITWHYYHNYGSKLQTYALVTILRSMGYEVKVLNYHNPKFGKVSYLKSKIKNLCNHIPVSIVKTVLTPLYFPDERFRVYFNETKLVYSSKGIENLCEEFDAIVCGSDQIWAPNVFNPVYFMDFVPDSKPKISYAASIGLNQIPEALKPDYKRLLNRIDYISVRESKGVELVKEISGRDATLVLDPTLLLSVTEWEKIAIDPIDSTPYLFCYFLKNDHRYTEAVKRFAGKNGLKIIGISTRHDDKEWMNVIDDRLTGPREFVGWIKNADTVITDSYHGTIFSLLFNRPFITIERFEDQEVINQNSRINQLKDYFNINNNIIKCNENTELTVCDIDRKYIDNRLSELREKSLGYLNDSLEQC